MVLKEWAIEWLNIHHFGVGHRPDCKCDFSPRRDPVYDPKCDRMFAVLNGLRKAERNVQARR